MARARSFVSCRMVLALEETDMQRCAQCNSSRASRDPRCGSSSSGLSFKFLLLHVSTYRKCRFPSLTAALAVLCTAVQSVTDLQPADTAGNPSLAVHPVKLLHHDHRQQPQTNSNQCTLLKADSHFHGGLAQHISWARVHVRLCSQQIPNEVLSNISKVVSWLLAS